MVEEKQRKSRIISRSSLTYFTLLDDDNALLPDTILPKKHESCFYNIIVSGMAFRVLFAIKS